MLFQYDSECNYLENIHATFGSETVAVLLSLPLVLLVWAIVTFGVGVVTYTFLGFSQEISGEQQPLFGVTSWVTLGVSISIACAVIVALYSFWDIWRFPGLRRSWFASWSPLGSNESLGGLTRGVLSLVRRERSDAADSVGPSEIVVDKGDVDDHLQEQRVHPPTAREHGLSR